MSDDFKRLVDASRNYHRAPHHNDVHIQLMRSVLSELRKMSEPMATAMMSVEWPEGMSAVDQMRAMHEAMIDVVMKE